MTILEKQIQTRFRMFDTNDIETITERLKPNLIEIKKVTPIKNSYEVVYRCYKETPPNYEELVNKMVREKYSESEEFAILRKTINNPSNEQFIEYNNFVEQCKLQVKAFIAERSKVFPKEV